MSINEAQSDVAGIFMTAANQAVSVKNEKDLLGIIERAAKDAKEAVYKTCAPSCLNCVWFDRCGQRRGICRRPDIPDRRVIQSAAKTCKMYDPKNE
jgi:hypothetical protein